MGIFTTKDDNSSFLFRRFHRCAQVKMFTETKRGTSKFGHSRKGRRWSEAISVGGLAFAEKVKSKLGTKALHREVEQAGKTYACEKSNEAYGVNLPKK